jgi:hypothetical protein
MCEGMAMPRVKVLFHDNCFDGAASASLFTRFYADRIDGSAAFAYLGKHHGQGEVYKQSCFDGDINAVVDFRYSTNPRLDWWFDHHVSAFPSPEEEAHFHAHPRPHIYYDPTARSCSKYLAETCAREFAWDWSPFAELVRWADIIDGAQFDSPQAAVELAEPALQLMTWVENNHDDALKVRFIDALTRQPLADTARERYVQDALKPILSRHRGTIDLIRARAALAHGVVQFDVADETIDAYNKFIPYYLFPECQYVVGVSRTPSRVKVSVGSNPWKQETRTANIAQICERYGGGGHPVVGAVSLRTDELARARQVATEIADELRRAADSR